MIEAITREEIFLAKAIGETVPDLEPIIRQEMFLAKIAGMDIAPPVPVTREEMYLNAIANKEVIDLKPITRREMFLAKAMGADIEVPNPITRIEYYLSQLTGGGSGGGSYEKYSWEGVFASIDKGTYATDYAIGDTVPLDLGSEGLINMQIAAFDTDDLADGSGKAPITWIAKELLLTPHRMNPSTEGTSGAYTEGTGSVGGWEKCEMRAYLKETIKPLMSEVVRNSIKEIAKTHEAYDTAGNKFYQTTIDDVWLPDKKELEEPVAGFGLIDERYELFKNDKNNKIKHGQDGYAKVWWTRSAAKYSTFRHIESTGDLTSAGAHNTYYVCLCFCT